MANVLNFPTANMVLTDTQLSTGNEQYALADISYAEVVTRRYPVDWRYFIQIYMILFLCFAVIWAIATSFGWISLSGPLLAIFWVLIMIYAAREQAKRAYRHTLTLETNSGTVEIATSELDDPLLEACEAINRRIKRNAATPTVPRSGEPTRWIQSN